MHLPYNVVLVEPQIPQNTGNIGRLCLATNSILHLVEPLGFDISEKAVRRSGLDYWQHLEKKVHPNFLAFKESLAPTAKCWYLTKFAEQSLFDVQLSPGDYFIFGRETTGIQDVAGIDANSENSLQIPMFSEKVRCLNLSNSVSIVVYEAIRQNRS